MAEEDLTPDEARAWLRQETDILNRAHQLRIKDATVLVEAYAQGKISFEDFAEQHGEYMDTWGETLHCIDLKKCVTDEEILVELRKKRGSGLRSDGAVGRVDSSRSRTDRIR